MADARRGEPGGIAALVELIDGHTSAFVYDWRHRFGLSLRDATETAPDWWETLHLAHELVGDPSSHVAAALAGWSRPWPAEAWVLADLVDVTIRANTPRRAIKPKPYPRPNDNKATQMGKATRPQHEIRAALAARGHNVDGG